MCDEFYVFLNVSKTKDLSIGYRKESVQSQPAIIHNGTVKSVDHLKYFGMVMDFKLNLANIVTLF